jgi:hypothetical protein
MELNEFKSTSRAGHTSTRQLQRALQQFLVQAASASYNSIHKTQAHNEAKVLLQSR